MGFSSSSNRGSALGMERMGNSSAPSMRAASNSTGSRTSTRRSPLRLSSRRFTSLGVISSGSGFAMQRLLGAPFGVLGHAAGFRLTANFDIQPLDFLIQRGKRHVQAV